MTTPFDPARPQDSQPVWAEPPSPEATEPKPPAAPGVGAPRGGGRGRTVALVGSLLAIVGLGAGGAWAWQQVGGGGAQPESVMPASTLAFVKVDLDPSGGQKLDAIRFARKFPKARDRVSEDSDLREVLVKALQEDGPLEEVDYARDVKPWLGKRLALGVVPGKDASSKPVPVVALAVTDVDAARKSLPGLASSLKGECQVLDDYALCTQHGTGQLAAVVGAVKQSSLAGQATFAKDMGDLGEDGIAAAWFDGTRLSKALEGFHAPGVAGLGLGSKGSPAASGHGAYALRFDGPHLELAGHVNGLATKLTAGSTGSTGLTDLPEGTLAAVGVAGAGEQLRAAWPQAEKSLKSLAGEQQYADIVAEAQDALGVTLPEDLFKALGSQLTLAFGGMGEGNADPQVALVTDGDRAVLQKLADALGEQTTGAPLALKQSGRRTVLALSEGYADTLAAGSGLGDSSAFRAAVPDAARARVAAYADVSGLLAAFKDEIPADEARDWAPLSAFGMTVSGEGDHADFRMRLTTK